MAPTLNVVKSMVKQFVHVFLDTLEHLPLVDLNVSQIQNVLRMKLATTRNVLTLAQAHVESRQIVKLEITIPFVHAHKDIQEILS